MKGVYEFSSLSGGYNGNEVIKNISGLIRPGRVTALIGPNGCGKSTLIKMFSGALPHSGELRLAERPFGSYSQRELGRLVGVVPQYSQFAHEFSVYEVICFGRLPHLRLLSPITAEDERAVLAAARSVGVEHLLFRGACSLSGGERQRVVAAMVMAQNPDVFLLDEPTSSLDPMHSVKIFKIMRELTRVGKTVVAAAHDVNTAMAYADDYIAIRDGKIIASGGVKSIGAEILEALYDAKFFAYVSNLGGVAWHSGIEI